MELDNIFGGINHNATTLPEVYGLDNEQTKAKLKRLVKAVKETEKSHEVIEMCKAEADSTDEALVLLSLLDKFFAEKLTESVDGSMAKLAMSLMVVLHSMVDDGDITEDIVFKILQAIEDKL